MTEPTDPSSDPTMVTWHVWQTAFTRPSSVFQYVAPQDGDIRPDGHEWTDPYTMWLRGHPTVLQHVGSVDGPPYGDFGLDDATSAAITAMAVPTGVPVEAQVVLTFGQ